MTSSKQTIDNSLTGAVLGLLIGGFVTWTIMPHMTTKYLGRTTLIMSAIGGIIGYKIGKKIKSTV